MSTLETKLLTADELLRMPEDGFRYELVKGELLRMSPTGDEHGRITMALASPLYQYVKSNSLGNVYAAETGFKLESNPDTVRAPDIAFVCNDRIKKTGRIPGFRSGAPDLAVEVMSPGDSKRELEEKSKEYFSGGSRMVWIVNPKSRTVTIYQSASAAITLTENDTLHGGDVVPGFRIAISEIFAN